MMVSIGVRVRRWQRLARRWLQDSRLHSVLQVLAYLGSGGLLSAASLGGFPLPLASALICTASGWPGILLSAGSLGGYLLFWGQAGGQGVLWVGLSLLACVFLGQLSLTQETPLLMSAISGAIVAVSGLLFQIWQGDPTPIAMYLLRIGLAAGATRLFQLALQKRDPVVDWLVCGVAVLALAQAAPIPWLNLGCIAAGFLAVYGAFPLAALAGLSLDLAQITAVPMTAALSLAWLTRLIPGKGRHLRLAAPAVMYISVMALNGMWDMNPVAGLLLGGAATLLLPRQTEPARRRSETGFAQVRLEMVSAVLSQTQRLLGEVELPPVDEQALLARAADRACSSCPCKKSCREKPGTMPAAVLHKPLGNGQDLPVSCRKTGRLLQELRHSQEQLRSIRADRDRQREYRTAVVQQYGFLADYLQELSDSLARRQDPPAQRFQPEIGVCSASREAVNGDRCFWFAGVECRYYILLCDGMGTGTDAARDANLVGNMLRKLLSAGYPATYALGSINSLCALRGCAGAVTVDLAELQLDTGRVTLYKWGAPPSFLLSGADTVKVGTALPPPGLSVADGREMSQRLSLRKGETLILLSDGAGGEDAIHRIWSESGKPAGELAAKILDSGEADSADDATVAVVRLTAISLST